MRKLIGPLQNLGRADAFVGPSPVLAYARTPSPANSVGEGAHFSRFHLASPARRCHPEAQAHLAHPYTSPRGPKDLTAATSQPGRGSGHGSAGHTPPSVVHSGMARTTGRVAKAGKPAAGKAESPGSGRCRVPLGASPARTPHQPKRVRILPSPACGRGAGGEGSRECAGRIEAHPTLPNSFCTHSTPNRNAPGWLPSPALFPGGRGPHGCTHLPTPRNSARLDHAPIIEADA